MKSVQSMNHSNSSNQMKVKVKHTMYTISFLKHIQWDELISANVTLTKLTNSNKPV